MNMRRYHVWMSYPRLGTPEHEAFMAARSLPPYHNVNDFSPDLFRALSKIGIDEAEVDVRPGIFFASVYVGGSDEVIRPALQTLKSQGHVASFEIHTSLQPHCRFD